jgi:hypothetical protein
MASEPFCDYLKITIPESESGGFREEVALFLSQFPMQVVNDGFYKLDGGGTVLIGVRGRVLMFSVSGAAIGLFRDYGLWGDLLSLIGDWPHRVTLMDVALDYFHLDGPNTIGLYDEKASTGQVRLSRKFIPGTNCRSVTSVNHEGRRTGTVYYGTRTSEVRAKTYDKQHERMCAGHADPGPWVRHELTVTGKMGPTLRDAMLPSAIFWHYMGQTLLERPEGVSDWVPYAEGYILPKRVPLAPYQALQRRVELSPEVDYLLGLATQCGPEGFASLQRMLAKRWESGASASIASKSDQAA